MLKNALFFSICLLVAAPAISFADAVYVPILGAEIDGVSYETRVSIFNDGTDPGTVTNYFVEHNADGNDRPEGAGEPMTLASGATANVLFNSSRLGLLEITTPSRMVFDARLTSRGGSADIGTQVPVVRSRNVLAANTTAHLRGWVRDGQRVTDFGLLNLGEEAALCSIDVLRADGSLIVENVLAAWEPISMRHFPDALALLGIAAIEGVGLRVTCDQPFYPYAVTFDRTTGELTFVVPSATGEFAIARTGDQPDCSPSAICFSQPGLFHQPSPGNLVQRIVMIPPFDHYHRVRVTLRVTHGGWAPNSSGTHNIFWFARDRNRDLFGYVNVRGPNRDNIFLRHGIGQPQGDKPRITEDFVMNPGETYLFDYVYDTGAGLNELRVFDSSDQEVVRLTDAPDVGTIAFLQGQHDEFLLDFGFAGVNPNEPPTLGWEYRDLFVEFLP